MHKVQRLLKLAALRQEEAWPGYKNVGDDHKEYECNYVSPWSKSAHNVDSNILIFLQDWSSQKGMSGPVDQDSIDFGYSRNIPTNIRLIELIKRHFKLDLEDIYVTNLFPFIKPGGASARIRPADMRRAATQFARPQLEIISPRIAICLGLSTFNAMRFAMSLPPVRPMASAISDPISHNGCTIFCQAHTGAWGQRNRGIERANDDWRRMAAFYRELPRRRRS
jgi:uracil-DNA glycosylase